MKIVDICELAEETARKYNPTNISPFPYEEVLKLNEDLKIYVVSLDGDISGATTFEVVEGKEKFSIFVNSTKPLTRRNFTIAHELGHYFLHKDILRKNEGLVDGEHAVDGDNVLYRLDGSESKRVETEANNFAASLIMPEQLVKKAWDALKSIEACANVFNVSNIAMSIRLERLGLSH